MGVGAWVARARKGCDVADDCRRHDAHAKEAGRQVVRCRARIHALFLFPLVLLLVVHGCSGPHHLHEVRIEARSDQLDPRVLVRAVSRPVIDSLTRNGFQCRTDYGHFLFYAACTREDHSSIGQTTNTFINVLYPDPDRVIEIKIMTGQLSYHPFTESNREHFVRWRDLVLSVIDSLPDVSYSDYEVE
jgi:hypothetical protein